MRCSLPALCVVMSLASIAAAEEEEAVVVYRAVQGSVVALENIEGSGTGIVLDAAKGLILTNAHVVVSPLPYTCKADVRHAGKSEAKSFKKVTVVGVHPTLDLALVRIDPKEHNGTLQAARLAKHKGEPGQRVYALGNPVGGGVVLNKTITSGILSGVDRVIEGVAYYQFSAPVNPGNSGGPLCDKAGQIIGLVTLKFNKVENVGFAIPLDDLKTADFVPLAKRRADPAQSQEWLTEAGHYYDLAQSLFKTEGEDSPEGRRNAAYSAHYFQLALLHNPGDPGLYYNVGLMLRQSERYEAATGYFLQAIELKPWAEDTGLYYRELGLALVKLHKQSEAIAAWGEGVAKFPKKAARIWEDLAIYHIMEAHDYYRAAYDAAVVDRLGAPNSRLEVAADILSKASAHLEAGRKADLDADVAKIGEDLRRRQDAADKARTAGHAYVTEAFADLMRKEGHTVPKDKPTVAKGDTKSPAGKESTGKGASEKTANDQAQKRPALDLTVPEGSVDLLREIDTVKGAVEGTWKFTDGALVSPMSALARVQIPTKLPEEYDLTLIVERKANRKEFVLGIVRNGAQAALVIDGAEGQATGFDPTGPGAYHGAVIHGGPVTLVCKVRRAGVLLTADGKRILLVKDSAALPAVPEDWQVTDTGALFLGTNTTRCLVHKFMLTPYKRVEK